MINLNLKNISKVYNKVTNQKAVDNVSFEANKGQFIVLLGPSGCGKSSLLRMIAGLEDISSGELYFDDKLMNNISPDKRNIGMVFQNYALYPHLSVYDNIAFPLKIVKISKSEIKKRVIEIADSIGLIDLLERKPKELSGGQRQRVALARALIRKPDVFLFDEPLSNLDAKLRVQMRTEIINIHKSAGTTSIYVTHDQTEAMTMGDILVILNKGRIQQIDTPHNVYKCPINIFVAGFIGSPQMNFFNGYFVQQDNLYFLVKDYDLMIRIIGNIEDTLFNKEIILGIRPEHLNFEILNSNNGFRITNIEFMGYEQILHFSSSHCICTARTEVNHSYHIGSIVQLSVESNLMHKFGLDEQRII